MKPSNLVAAVALAILALLPPARVRGQAPGFELVDGDRVVLIGGTMIERDQSFGTLETRLTRRYPDRNLTFRNLGWSGDTVEGPSRARFGPTAEGYQHLIDHVRALRPTVVIVGYGANEAFEGPAGLERFARALDRLLKDIEPTKARLVFLSPPRQENLGPPLPDPTRHNADLALYRDALRAEATRRGAAFVDLFGRLPESLHEVANEPLTSNGLHFTPYGYWALARLVEKELFPKSTPLPIPIPPAIVAGGSPPGHPSLEVFFPSTLKDVTVTPTSLRFQLLDKILPGPNHDAPMSPGSHPFYLFVDPFDRVIKIANLTPGRYVLKIDGQPVKSADHVGWGLGQFLNQGPEFDQVEALRQAINAKNELYFYRWRPQNETYLFGFRKHEQGRNAREVAEFDPLIAAKEAEIARLRMPVPHLYELIREGEVGR